MKEFFNKYKTDQKFNDKVQIIFYMLFVVVALVIGMTGNKTPQNNDLQDSMYDYKININLNDNLYNYYGTKTSDEITINKVVNENTISYSYKNATYYKYDNNVYVAATEEEIYDVIAFNYLSLETINKYIDMAHITEDKYIVYLDDIVIGSSSDEYITIEKKSNNYNIDYTSLMKLFDNSIEKLTVEIIIE